METFYQQEMPRNTADIPTRIMGVKMIMIVLCLQFTDGGI